MSYSQARDREQLQRLQTAVNAFIVRYQSNPSTTKRKTVILFPGGMGSQLVRAITPHEDGPPYFFNAVWLDCSVLFGAALDLKIQGGMDRDRKFIITDGCVDFPFFGLRPYEDFIQWCEQNKLDWFVFGWDWRRRLEDTVDLFVDRFLPMFQRRVAAACGADPLQDYAAIGHSMGGMVLKLVLNRGGIFVDKMAHAVTVATPFYGHAGHMHRYFKGDPLLNGLYGTSDVTEVISTMPGGYALLYLDKDTYHRDESALASDPQYPLSSYPLVDANNASVVADPYNPQTQNALVRYPQRHGFDHAELQRGKLTYQQVAAPLTDPAVSRKFYNIRGVQRVGGTVAADTINSQTWARIATDFDADVDPNPISDVTMCPGDGLIPAWSARLVTSANVVTIVGDLEHMDMMNFPKTHDALAKILNLKGRKRKRRSPQNTPKIASRRELMNFLDGLAEAREEFVGLPKIYLDQATLRYLAKFNRAQLSALIGRAYVDAPKSPSQKLGTAPTPELPKKSRSRKPTKAPSSRRTK
jgi:hypothetical protein